MLYSSENEYSKFITKKCCVIDSESKSVYSYENPIKFLTSLLESSLCDYSDAYVPVTGNIAVVGANDNAKAAFKNCTPLRKFRTEVNEIFIDEAEHISIAVPMYNLIIYSNSFSDTSRSLWQFKRDKIEGEDVDLTVDGNHILNNSSSFKYKSSLITNRYCVKIAVTLKYNSNLGWSWEMPLINFKVELSLSLDPNCILSIIVGASTFTITDAKLYVPVVTLSI